MELAVVVVRLPTCPGEEVQDAVNRINPARARGANRRGVTTDKKLRGSRFAYVHLSRTLAHHVYASHMTGTNVNIATRTTSLTSVVLWTSSLDLTGPGGDMGGEITGGDDFDRKCPTQPAEREDSRHKCRTGSRRTAHHLENAPDADNWRRRM